MLVYQIVNPNSPPSSGIYHENINAAIMYFLMSGNKGAYLGNMTNDWDNYKEAGWTVKEYILKEVTHHGHR